MLRAIAELNGAALAPSVTVTKPVRLEEAERRHLTVMFCDRVGSTVLSARLDRRMADDQSPITPASVRSSTGTR